MGQLRDYGYMRDTGERTRWRRPIDLSATVQEQGSCAFAIRVVDLSPSGCHIRAGFRLTPDRPARISMENFAPFRGRILWAKNWRAAIAFDQELHYSVVNHLVTRNPPSTDHPYFQIAIDGWP